jgi:hypothetical protein
MLSSPGCWAAYGQVLAREYQDQAYYRLHRLSVDAYAAQHPGKDNAQARNSVGVHLSRLCLLLEMGWPMERANAAMVEISAKKRSYPWLEPPQFMGAHTVRDVLEAATPAEHEARVRAWADSVWAAWSEHHATVRGWVEEWRGDKAHPW